MTIETPPQVTRRFSLSMRLYLNWQFLVALCLLLIGIAGVHGEDTVIALMYGIVSGMFFASAVNDVHFRAAVAVADRALSLLEKKRHG